MVSRTTRLLSSLAALCAAATASSATAESGAAELLRVAQATAERIADGPAAADDLAGDVTLRILERHPEALDEAERWHGYVRQCIRNAHRDELRRRRRTHDVTAEDAESKLGFALESPAGDDGFATAAVEEFRSRLEKNEQDVLDLVVSGHRERRIAELLGRTRYDVRSSLDRIRRSAEHTFGNG